MIDEGCTVDLSRAFEYAIRDVATHDAGIARLKAAVARVSELLARRRRGLVALARVLFRVSELTFDEARRVVESAEETGT